MSFRFVTAGESHGPGLTAIVEGLPAGLELRPEDIDRDLARRQLGHGRGGRMKIEKDRAEVTAGRPPRAHARQPGRACWIDNRDYQNWEERMNPWPVDAEVDEVHLPRPGHADLAGVQKYGHTDVRNVLERASARARPPRGWPPARSRRRSCARSGWRSRSHVTQIGIGAAPDARRPGAGDFEGVDESPVRCLDADASEAMVDEIDAARKANESLGGVFEVRAFGLVPGHRLARLLGGAPRRPAGAGDHVDPGDEGRRHRRRVRRWPGGSGSQAHDEIFWSEERGYFRETNRAGRHRGRHDDRRPAGRARRDEAAARRSRSRCARSTSPPRSPPQALRERTDSCTVPAAGVVGEAMVALVLAAAYREKFGGDHIDDARAALGAYEERIGWRRW